MMKKREKPDLSDGVDYVRFNLFSENHAPEGDFEPCDGSIRINLDEITYNIKRSSFTNPEGEIIARVIDVLGHEMDHKWFVWGMGSDWDDDYLPESFNEMDERVMRCISDWINFGEKHDFLYYDYH